MIMEFSEKYHEQDLWIGRAAKLSFALVLGLIPAVLLLISGRTIPALVYSAIPITVLLVASPRYSFYLFLAVNFIYAPYHLTGFAVHPWDIAGVIFFTAVLVSWLFRYKLSVQKTRFDYNLWALILATFISGMFAYNRMLSIVPLTRIVVIYIAYRAFYYLSGVVTPSRMLRSYINVYTAISLYHCCLFISGGGTLREFGISGIAFETFCMVGVPVTLAHAIWSRTIRKQLIYSAFFLVNLTAAVATMSRGPLLTISVALPVLLVASYLKAKRLHISSARKFVRSFVLIIVPLVIVIIIGSGIFLQVGERFEELVSEQPTGTVLLRLSLWKTAWQGFLLKPITGIGIGNFRLIDVYLPLLRFEPHRYYLVGMSFHNVFLQYLSETGLLGAVALLLLVWNVFITGRRTMRDSTSDHDMTTVASIYICSFIFAITVFYMRAWTWGQEGYILALILALLARQRTLSEKVGHS
jgi:hypothetical protein